MLGRGMRQVITPHRVPGTVPVTCYVEVTANVQARTKHAWHQSNTQVCSSAVSDIIIWYSVFFKTS